MMASSFSAGSQNSQQDIPGGGSDKPKGGSALIDSARKKNSQSVLGSSGQKRVTFPAVLAQPMNERPASSMNQSASAGKTTAPAIKKH